MNALNKKMAKRTGTLGAAFSISKIVDFIEAGPFGSALFLCGENRAPQRVIPSTSQRVILSAAKDLAFID